MCFYLHIIMLVFLIILFVLHIKVFRIKNIKKLNNYIESYRAIFNNSSNAIYILKYINNDYEFVDVNDGSCRMYEYEREFFIGKTPVDLQIKNRNNLELIKTYLDDTYINGINHTFEFIGRKSSGIEFYKKGFQ